MPTKTEVRERPILFSGPMVRALLDGRKMQTRRVVKCVGGLRRGDRWAGPANPASGRLVYRDGGAWDDALEFPRAAPIAKCPHGQPGERLWVRETWGYCPESPGGIEYRASWTLDDEQSETRDFNWRPSIHMPRWASRITLEITGVRVERVQEISEEDAAAEGAFTLDERLKQDAARTCLAEGRESCGPRDYFRELWGSINGERPGCSWDANPWVWVIEFQRIGE